MLPLPESSPFSIARLQAGDQAMARRWDAFVMACPEATFFHRAGWQNVLSGVLKHPCYFLYAHHAGEVLGVLPLAHVQSWLFGRSLVSLPFAVYGGVAASQPDVAQALEREAQALAQQLGVAHLELRHRQARHPDWPQQGLYVTFQKDLAPDESTNLLAIPRKQRAMIRKGMGHGLVSVLDPQPHRFFALYANNMLRHGTPALPLSYFKALKAEFGDDCEVMTVQNPQGQAVSSVLSFYFRQEVLPYYAGDLPCARALAANDFKYWELMRRAGERGFMRFDFGRSKQGTGSYAFKKNWGFEPSPLHYEYCLYQRDSVPQHNPSNARYQQLIALWRRLPQGLANWLGPHVVRNLG